MDERMDDVWINVMRMDEKAHGWMVDAWMGDE